MTVMMELHTTQVQLNDHNIQQHYQYHVHTHTR